MPEWCLCWHILVPLYTKYMYSKNFVQSYYVGVILVSWMDRGSKHTVLLSFPVIFYVCLMGGYAPDLLYQAITQ